MSEKTPIETHDELNPLIWRDGELRPEVEEKLNIIADDFIEELEENNIPVNVVDVRVVGSNAGYNYNETSDLDLHIVVEMGEEADILNLLYLYFKSDFNDKYSIKIHGVNIELYVEDINHSANSDGIYSLMYGGWLKRPLKTVVTFPDTDELFNTYETAYFEVMQTEDGKEAQDLINRIYSLRKNSIKEEGEYGQGNLVFKRFRAKGYLQDLKDIVHSAREKEWSLEGLYKELKEGSGENMETDDKNKNIERDIYIAFNNPDVLDSDEVREEVEDYFAGDEEYVTFETYIRDTLSDEVCGKGDDYDEDKGTIFDGIWEWLGEGVFAEAGQRYTDYDGFVRTFNKEILTDFTTEEKKELKAKYGNKKKKEEMAESKHKKATLSSVKKLLDDAGLQYRYEATKTDSGISITYDGRSLNKIIKTLIDNGCDWCMGKVYWGAHIEDAVIVS